MIGGNGIKYFYQGGIPSLIVGGNKMQQEVGHQTIIEILEGGLLI